jgi:hypothetical protein
MTIRIIPERSLVIRKNIFIVGWALLYTIERSVSEEKRRVQTEWVFH